MGNAKVMFISIFALFLMVGVLFTLNSANAAPTLSSSAQTETTITLSWTKSSDATFYDYFVAYSTSLNGSYNDVAIISNSSQTTIAITDLTQNTTYYFIVRDYGSNGVSNSTSASNICQVATASNPEFSLVSSTSTTVSLSWKDYNTYTSMLPFHGYVLQMSKAGGEFTNLTSISNLAQDTYTVEGLSPATSYQFRIYDEVGTLGQLQTSSNIVSVETQVATGVPEYPLLFVLLPLILIIFAIAVASATKKQSCPVDPAK